MPLYWPQKINILNIQKKKQNKNTNYKSEEISTLIDNLRTLLTELTIIFKPETLTTAKNNQKTTEHSTSDTTKQTPKEETKSLSRSQTDLQNQDKESAANNLKAQNKSLLLNKIEQEQSENTTTTELSKRTHHGKNVTQKDTHS